MQCPAADLHLGVEWALRQMWMLLGSRCIGRGAVGQRYSGLRAISTRLIKQGH